MVCFVLAGERCEIFSPKNIDKYGFVRIFFDQWHVLVGRGVIYHREIILLEEWLNSVTVRNISEHKFKLDQREFAAHLDLYFIQRSFCLIKHNNQFWFQCSDLTYNFTADRTGSTRDQNRFVEMTGP